MQDDDCMLLQHVFKNIENINVIEITPSTDNWNDCVDKAIQDETDTLIFMGHGTNYGLLFPDFYRGEYILHENNVGLINAKNVICIWCNASTFCQTNNVKGFSTSMFISNVKEAYDNCIYDLDQDQINSNTVKFCEEINSLIRDNVPLNEWYILLNSKMDIENSVDVFNRQGLYYH